MKKNVQNSFNIEEKLFFDDLAIGKDDG